MVLLFLFLNIVLTIALPHRLSQGNYIGHHHHHHSTNHSSMFHPGSLPQLKSTPPFPSPSSPPNPSLTAHKIFLGFFIFGFIMMFVFPPCALAPFFLRRKKQDAEGIVLEERIVVLPPGDIEEVRRPEGLVLPVERVCDV
jgi:hypothetical protein